jgi:hypothetical protein
MCQAQEEECIGLIKELAISYARQEQCLILVAVSMEGKLLSNGEI